MNSNETSSEIISTRVIAFSPERVFGAFRDSRLLAQWWGPKGFKNTFHEFDFRPGGHWRFVMHGPDGTDYKNENVFGEIVEPGIIVVKHVSWPKFELAVTLAEEKGKTGITWRMRFESADDYAKVQAVCVEANQQNFDRLEAVLGAESSADSGTLFAPAPPAHS